MSAEFRALGANASSPVTQWLRALARLAHGECGGPGVGAIGMCFTGNFALSMMLEPAMLARVLAQPSLPLDERVRFALAGYNAGFARVQDARRLAAELGLDPNTWKGNVEKAMGLMARPFYARRVRTGFCRCQEPVDYVKHIENKYASFAQLVKD